MEIDPLNNEHQHVVIIGAGIAGVCCAAYLQRAGCKVTLIDRQPPGEACSFGNAGSLSPSSCIPIAVPGLLPKVPRWLFGADAPLTIRWRYLLQLAPWLWQFVRAGNWEKLRESADALSALHTPSVDLHKDLAATSGDPGLISSTDYLHIYKSEQAFANAQQLWQMKAERGASFEALDGEQLREIEPDLSMSYVRAIRIRDQGFVLNPSRHVKAIAAHVVSQGGELITDEVQGFEVQGERVVAVNGNSHTIRCDAVVVATGAWSRNLTRMLGFDVPLEAERGYHVTLPKAGIRISGTIMETERMFVATPMEMGVRFAGTVELANVDAPPDYRRAKTVLRGAKEMFPKLDTETFTEWMGCRPSLPDGVPIIGRSPAQANVYLAFGHARTGMCGSPMTGASSRAW